jgi:hypothetical protein
MVFIKPESVSDEEVLHLVAAVVENKGSPIHVLAKAGIFVP